MFLVSALSLLLLIYVGFGEAQRNYYQFLIDEVTAQGKIVQNTVDTHLDAGLPLRQYIGFSTLTRPIIDSDEAITSMIVVDRTGRRVFESGDQSVPLLPSSAQTSNIQKKSGVEVRGSKDFDQLVLPLGNRFESVGNLIITLPRSILNERMKEPFEMLLYIALGLSLSFAVYVGFGGKLFRNTRLPWQQIGYGVTFVAMAAIVIGTLINLYSEGAQIKTKALANSLGQSLSDIVTFNLNIDQFEGLGETLEQYRKLNPDISAAALTVNDIVQIHTNPDMVGKPLVKNRGDYEFLVDLSRPEANANKIQVAVVMPSDVVYRQVFRTVKNFAALFIASAFLAGLFLQFAGSVQNANFGMAGTKSGQADSATEKALALNLVKPVFFVAIFLEHLNYPFLPQYILEITEQSGLSASFASAPFMAYYLFFALALIPAGHFSDKLGPRQLIIWGLALAAIGVLSLVVTSDVYAFTIARALSGIGQGMLFIGVQSYIFATTSPDRKTQGAAIIVIGFQGGMISGTAIGSLLVGYLGPQGVFLVSSATAFLLSIYIVALVPNKKLAVAEARTGLGNAFRSLGRDLGQVLRSGDFMRTMLLIGIPAKAVMTGIVVFGIPLLLSQMGYAHEDIGQVIMLYAIGVLVASNYVSRFVDRTGQTNAILFWGTAISGIGLIMIGMIEWQTIISSAQGTTTLLIAGVLILGLAHGFVCAPVITSIGETRIAQEVGASSVTATYRFLERIGHIAGPIIVGQLFLFANQGTTVFIWVGVAVIVMGLIFVAQAAAPTRRSQDAQFEDPQEVQS
jgi:MFS family permease